MGSPDSVRRALLLSALLHALLLGILRCPDFSGLNSTKQGPLALVATLVAPAENPETDRLPPRAPLGKTTQNPTSPGGDFGPFFRSTAAKPKSAQSTMNRTAKALGQDIGPDPEGLREYRLILARVARQFRLGGEPGTPHWQGVVLVAISKSSGAAPPTVGLSKGSGQPLLDAYALDMASRAVDQANVPDTLQGQGFELVLPIHFQAVE